MAEEPSADDVAPDAVRRFREAYRAAEVGPGYRGWLHFATTSVVSLAVVGFAASRVHAASALEWVTVPATFLFANFVEWAGHRGPMHHPRRPLEVLFQRHTREHHRFFTHEAMTYASSRDFKMVLFPPVMLVFFLGGVATPLAALLFLVASPNVAWLYVTTAMAYFLTYEWLHFAYHLDPRSGVGALPGMRALRRHHTRHHDPRIMNHANFNITFPLADLLFGTRERTPEPARDAG